ncbi:hypothetical protein B0J18DRAFT_223993 [Chaetomium sp. MPI-SDFR-AT-0129]|nr:hypothetical protein B0J18DRAFT_223993 [Chaetomium sp. MPI-SDFR-AT-0129]
MRIRLWTPSCRYLISLLPSPALVLATGLLRASRQNRCKGRTTFRKILKHRCQSAYRQRTLSRATESKHASLTHTRPIHRTMISSLSPNERSNRQ